MAIGSKDGTRPPAELLVRIWRGGETGGLETYRVPDRPGQTVLDVLGWVRRYREPALAYRFACRVGACGSCALTVNGRPRRACRTPVAGVAKGGTLTLEPLRNLPRVKDLVTDLRPFLDSFAKAGAVFTGARTRHEPRVEPLPPPEDRRTVDAAGSCIGCAICWSACDVVGWQPGYLGPAALDRAWALVNDPRHADREVTADRATGSGGCHGCHSQGSCARHCPIGLDPTQGIGGLKRLSLTQLLRRRAAR